MFFIQMTRSQDGQKSNMHRVKKAKSQKQKVKVGKSQKTSNNPAKKCNGEKSKEQKVKCRKP